MGVIADKIKDNKLFFKFILIAEISYLVVLLGLLLPEKNNQIPSYPFLLLCAGFLCMVLVHIIFFISSFFDLKIKSIRKEVVELFLFRLILIIMWMIFFVQFR